MEFNLIKITRGQGDLLSGILFLLSTLAIAIKIQMMTEVKPYVHNLKLIPKSNIFLLMIWMNVIEEKLKLIVMTQLLR